MNKILPEAWYKFNENFDYDDLYTAYLKNETVYGTVVDCNEDEEYLTVRLGDKLYAKLPFSEVSIYPFKYSNNSEYKLPFQVYSILNKTIAAKVHILKLNETILSRKSNMKEAFKSIKNSKYLPFYVTSVSECDVFGDVGDGITARIPLCKVCKTRIHSARELIQKDHTFTVKITACDDEKMRFLASYKDTFDKYNPNVYCSGEKITGIVNEVVDDSNSGYFVYISPQTVGIVDNNNTVPKLNYGDKIDCMVTRATKKGLHLKFLNFSND